MNDYILIGLILIFAALAFYYRKELNHLKKERDYWHEIDEENERLRKKQ